jgi:pyruvate formate lyase activating enzyme
MNRRNFFKTTAGLSAALTLAEPLLEGLGAAHGNAYAFGDSPNLSRAEARFYKKHAHQEIECELCPRKCKVGDQERGFCGVRENQGGVYYTLVHGRPCTAHVDPIEKKPFYHFLPGTTAFSLATAGCNLNCKFCQNWEISQARPEQTNNATLPPQDLIKAVQRHQSPTIAYTYSEPVVFYEYMYDSAILSRRHGIRNVAISAGYIEKKPLIELCKVLDAVKIDLKAYTESYYQDICRGKLKPVLEGLETLADQKMWTEIVYLVVPTLNDNMADIKKMSLWIRQRLGANVPLHFSRFYPMYQLKNLPPTPVSTLERARQTARDAGLKYVYIGNVPGHEGDNTYCPRCQKILIARHGFKILENKIRGGNCSYCGEKIPGVWV